MRFEIRAQDVLARAMIAFACMCALATPRASLAQEWARKMFATTSHDFGVVPRGAKSEFEFRLTNTYKENVHIASARSSCACTQPKILKSDLKTYEEGAIIAELNTQAFVGTRSAVVTVVIDRPYYAEVQLLVKGNIRSDILIEPGEVQFGNVDVGAGTSADVRVSYQGSSNRDWQITDVRSTNQNLSVKLDPLTDSSGRTAYHMTVRLKESAPVGELNDEIQIVTNERQFNQVTLPVRASVLPPLSIAPQSIELGSVKPGTKAGYRLVVKAKVPFEISRIDCEDDRFRFDVPSGAKPLHIIPIRFEADGKTGAFKRTITVISNLPDGASAEVIVTGNVLM